MLAVVIAFLFGGRTGYSPAQWIVCIIVGFATLGFADDILDLGAAIRLAAQVVLAGVAATFLSRGISAPQLITIGFIALLIVGYVNAFNFMDGINGISAINAIATGSWYALLGLTYHQDSLLVLGGAVAGAAAGFLPWNAPTARIFMGDVGATHWGLPRSSWLLLAQRLGSHPCLSQHPWSSTCWTHPLPCCAAPISESDCSLHIGLTYTNG